MNNPSQQLGSLITRLSAKVRDTLSGNFAAVGLINIYSKAADPELERKIISSSASYGRQLGILMDTLDYLIEQSPNLDSQAESIRRFVSLRNDINKVKVQHHRSAEEQADQLVQDLESLSRSAPTQFNRIKPQMLKLLIDVPVLEPLT